jgi:hypothetical protein
MSGAHKISARVRVLTEDEAHAWRARFSVQLKSFQREYETATGIERNRCLLAALTVCDPLQSETAASDYRVPQWLYAALCEQQHDRLLQEHDTHLVRWYAVYVAHVQKRLTWPQAYEDAAETLKGTSAAGTARTMRESYRIVVRRNRPHRRR